MGFVFFNVGDVFEEVIVLRFESGLCEFCGWWSGNDGRIESVEYCYVVVFVEWFEGEFVD